jgi:hypothetical protein
MVYAPRSLGSTTTEQVSDRGGGALQRRESAAVSYRHPSIHVDPHYDHQRMEPVWVFNISSAVVLVHGVVLGYALLVV